MIHFTSEIKAFKLKDKRKLKAGLTKIALAEGKKIDELNYIFVDDDALLEINKQFLAHETFTDIITFDNNDDDDNFIEGDIFISVERVKENAQTYRVSFDEELIRVISHGLLHLCGYQDKTREQKKLMRLKEEEAIQLIMA